MVDQRRAGASAFLRRCLGGYINRILNEDKPKFRALSPRTYIKRTKYPDLEFAPSFAAFRTQRADLLEILEPLPPRLVVACRRRDDGRQGHGMDRSVLDYAQRLTDHEREHVRQITEIADKLRA